MEIKKHFKLYKSGKQWITAAIAAVAVTTGIMVGATTAHADTQADQSVDAQTQVIAKPTTTQEVSTTVSNAAQTATPAINNTQSQNQNYDHNDNGNYGAIDSVNLVNNQLHVSGWSAGNQNVGKNNHLIIAYDLTNKAELGRVNVITPVVRPDVQKVHNVYNAAQSGFDVNIPLNFDRMQSYRDSIQIISRYSANPAGNSAYADYLSQPISFDRRNNGYLDSFNVQDGQLTVTGWNATSESIGKKYHHILLFDQTAGHEVGTRQLVKDGIQRNDVAKAYPMVANANQSGFKVTFNVSSLDPSHEYQIISRYSNEANGEGETVDHWFDNRRIAPATLTSQGHLDIFDASQPGKITATGWHAADISGLESNHFVILYDLTANKQVASTKVNNVTRNDVARVYPKVLNAKNSGFNATFDMTGSAAKGIVLGHQYVIVSRYSSSADGNGGNGKTTDFWSSPVTMNRTANAIDKVALTPNGLNVRGWMASDASAALPNAYIIVMGNNGEVTRQKLNLVARPDVAKVYPGMYNSLTSGFDTSIKLTSDQVAKLKDNFHLILRFSAAENGDPTGNNSILDQTSANYQTADAGNFNYINAAQNRVEFSGWHDSLLSSAMPNQWVIVLVNGREAKRVKLPLTDINLSQAPQSHAKGSQWDGSSSKFRGGIVLSKDLTNQKVQLIHRYSKSSDGNSEYTDLYSPVINVGNGYSNNRQGYGDTSDRTVRDLLAQRVADYLENKGLKDIAYDWLNQSNNFKEVTVRDIAQELAYGDVNNDPQVIAEKLHNNALLDGKVVATAIYDKPSAINYDQLAKQFVNDIAVNEENNGSVIGVGMSNNKLAIVMFKPGEATKADQATSSLSAGLSNVYKHSGVTVDVKDGLKKGDTVSAEDLGNALAQPSKILLTGNKGTVISEDVLKTIFAALPGNTNVLEGVKNYYNGDDAYHYQFWLDGQSADDKLNNFLQLNKGAKYGDQLKVNYIATLVYGPEISTSLATNETPASKRTSADLTLAYQKGTETGARYDTVKVAPIPGMKQDTIRGVDISSYLALVKNGVQFYDFNGQPASLLKVLSDAGVNYVRLRLWVDPYNAAGQTYGGGIDDEATVLEMAKEAQQYGMKVLLGLHYSDFWADPATQIVPKQWKGLSDDDLNSEVYLYTKKLANDFKQAGVNIDMAQLGNEITRGFLGIRLGNGDINVWTKDPYATKMANLLNSASKGFREGSKDTQLAVHIETPNMYNYKLILDSLKSHNVDYDVLASSYYPFWGWGNNNPNNIANIEKMVKDKYGKKFVVAETGWPFTLQNSDGTPNNIGYNPGHYKVGPQGQVDEMADLYKAVLSNDNGLGVFYWEPAWIPAKAGWDNWQYNKMMGDVAGTGWASISSRGYYPDSKIMYQGKSASGGSSWDNNTLFDDQGHPLQSLLMYKGFLEGYQSPDNVSSTLTAKLKHVYNNDQVDVINPITTQTKLYIEKLSSPSGREYLNGIKGTEISEASLKALFADLEEGMNSSIHIDRAGNKYHYEFWLDGQTQSEKLANFLNLNKGVKYGDPLKVNYTATLVKNKKTVTATSPVTATLSTVYGLDGVTIKTPLVEGEKMPAADLANIQKAVNTILTGAEGTTINAQAFKNLNKALPGVYGTTGALSGTKVYTMPDGNQYHYEYWLTTDDVQGANKDVKFGEPLNLTYSASLKWIDPKNK